MLKIINGEIHTIHGAFVSTLGHSLEKINNTSVVIKMVPWLQNTMWVLCLNKYQKRVLGTQTNYLALTKKENSIFRLTRIKSNSRLKGYQTTKQLEAYETGISNLNNHQ